MDPQNPANATHGNQNRPVYDTSRGGHYGASQALSQSGFAPAELYTGPWANVHQGLHGQYKDILTTYWQQMITQLESETHDYKVHQLPLARIKKVMKADPEVKMISAEAPILFAKGCDIFITELTMRAWIHAEENKRRTLQRSDIASALAKSDMFDFLIDIVPREEASSQARSKTTGGGGGTQASAAGPPGAASGAGGPGGGAGVPGQPGPPGHGGLPPSANHAGQPHPMAANYPLAGHALAGEPDYRQGPADMYNPQVQAGAQPPYGQPQGGMYGDIEGMYTYPAMPAAQQAPMQAEEFE